MFIKLNSRMRIITNVIQSWIPVRLKKKPCSIRIMPCWTAFQHAYDIRRWQRSSSTFHRTEMQFLKVNQTNPTLANYLLVALTSWFQHDNHEFNSLHAHYITLAIIYLLTYLLTYLLIVVMYLVILLREKRCFYSSKSIFQILTKYKRQCRR